MFRGGYESDEEELLEGPEWDEETVIDVAAVD